MMADDTTLSLIDIKSVENAIKKFINFETYSGLKLNLGKTILIPIGKCNGIDIKLPSYLGKITVKHGPFKALGIWFSENESEIESLNIDDRLKKMETMINIWTSRHLSLKGKITIIRTLILPQIQFLFSSIAISPEILKKIDGLLRNFLWNRKPSKIKKSTIIANIEQGGLKMVDVYSVHDCC